MHQFVGSEGVDNLDAIQLFLHKANLLKEYYIDYLKIVLPLVFDKLDEETKRKLLKFINNLFFEEEEKSIEDTKKAFKDIQQQFKQIVTLGGEELTSLESNKLKSFKKWMT